MGQKYILETEPFYRQGHYYRPGEPFEIAAGTTPPTRAIKLEEYVPPQPAPPEPNPAMSELAAESRKIKRQPNS